MDHNYVRRISFVYILMLKFERGQSELSNARCDLSEDEAEVNVEEPAFLVDHQVFQMPIADSEQVCGNRVRSTCLDVGLALLFELLLVL